jgi:hypothetical protein
MKYPGMWSRESPHATVCCKVLSWVSCVFIAVVETPQPWLVWVGRFTKRNDSPRFDGACAVFFSTHTKIYSQDKRYVAGQLPSLAFTCFV